MEKYLRERIAHLKKTEIDYFERSVSNEYPKTLKSTFRNFSNECCGRRQELEELAKKFNVAIVEWPIGSGYERLV